MKLNSVIHVITSLDPIFGGPPRVVESLAVSQSKQFSQVYIVTTHLSDSELSLVIDIQQRISLTHDNVNVLSFRAFSQYRFSPGLIAFIFKSQISSIFHFHGLYRFPTTVGAAICRFLGYKYVIRPHGSLDPWLYTRSSNSRLFLYLKRVSEHFFDFPNLRRSLFVHFTTSSECSKVLQLLPFNFNPIVIPNGISTSLTSTLPIFDIRKFHSIPSASKIILYIGRLHSKKGIDILLQSFTYVDRDLDAVLLVCGPPSDDSDTVYSDLIDSLPLYYRNRIYYHNSLVPPELVSLYFSQSSLFVLPSYTENFGMTVIEALYNGCPALISKNVDILPDLIESGLVSECSMNSVTLGSQISSELRSGTLYSTASSTGKEFIEHTYSWPSIVSKLLSHYQSK